MKAGCSLLCATTLGIACSSETARPAAFGGCVSEKDASCVAPPVAATMTTGDAGSSPSIAVDAGPSATTQVEGGQGPVAPSGEGGLATVAPSAEAGIAESGSLANPAGAEAGARVVIGSE